MQIPTPLVPLPSLGEQIFAKLEFVHPSGSMKHRSIPPFVEAAVRCGRIPAGAEIAIRSAGAAAVATAWIGARLAVPVTAVLPASAPMQIVRTLAWLGAKAHRVDHARAAALMAESTARPDVYVLEQAAEPALCEHYHAVAAEILAQLPQAAGVVTGLGTGLSAMGLADYLAVNAPDCGVYGVEPSEAAIASGGPWRAHNLPGLAPPRERPLLDVARLAGIENVATQEAWAMARFVSRSEGIPLGPSSGAATVAALRIAARRASGPVVVICACSFHDYLELADS